MSQTSGASSGTAFGIGTATISYSATDGVGNTASCSFTVTVSDDQDPAISCPSNITTDNDPGLCTATLTFANASFSDNCPGVTLAQTTGSASGSPFPEGTQTVTFVATDAAGNTNSCSFTITVEDNEAPIFFNCPANISVGTDGGTCDAVVTWATLASNDNCDGTITPVQTSGLGSGATFPEGVTTETWTATDGEGNVGTCTFTVTVTDDEGPQINCPSDQTVTFDGNCQYELLDYVAQVGFLDDNCDASPTVTQSPAATTVITGSTGITMTAEDDAGNTASCTFFVNPNDVVDPTITCPSDQNVNVNSICQFTLPDFTNATVSDDCDPNPAVTQVPSIGSILTATTQVTLTVTDGAGNTANCTFDAIPFDATDPVVTCPGAQTETFDADCEFDLADYTGLPTVTDNCDASPTVTQSPAIGFTISGTQVVTLTAEDANGNTSSCTFSVIPDDTTDPVVTCPSDQNVSFNSLCSFNVVNYTGMATATDNCDNTLTLSQDPVAGTAIGTTTTVEITATDDDGNSGTCTFDLIPADNSAPNISCPVDQVVNGNASCEASLLSYVSSTITSDNCDGNPTVTQSPTAGTTVSGSTTVNMTSTDAGGNAATCTFSVIVNDVTDPTITCGADLNVSFDGDCEYTVGNYVSTPTVSDNCDASPTVTQSPSVGTVITGTTTVTLTATDDAGNAESCTFSIIPADNQNPSVSCPSNLNVNFNADCEFTLADYTGSATVGDNCDVNPTVVQSPAFGTVITSTQVVTITVTDDAGNTNNCTFSVIPADNTNPTISCPSDQNEDFSASCNFTLPDYTGLATAADNCDNSVAVTQSPAVSTVITGAQTVTLTATDNDANTTTCTFSVIPADNTDPTISCGSDLNVSFDTDCEFTLLDYTSTATAADNCGTPAVTQSPNVSTVISGTTTVTLTATDGAGNTATCTFDIIPDDTVDPTVSCPGDQNINFNVDCEYALADYTGMATASDNCDVNPVITQSLGFGTVLSATQTVTITATDDAGNTATCTLDVIPSDVSAPTLTCPADQSEDFDADCEFDLPSYTSLVTAADNCDATVSLTQSPVATTTISGAQVITITGTDDAGNSSTCTFSVLPDDNTDPTISCPSDQNVSYNAQCQFSLQSYTSLGTAADNCDGSPVVTQSPVSGTSISTTTTVTLTATDANGNTGTCTFDVIPADNTDPTISCPADQNVSFDASCEYDLLNYVGLANTDDNCDPSPTVTQSPVATTTISATQTVTLTVEDADGNTGTCTFDVIPADNTIPTITCPADLDVSFDGSCQYTLSSYTGSATAADNCDGSPTITQSPVSGTVITGTTEITLTATDASGNLNTCTFDVIPDDDVDPTITCPSDQVIGSNVDCDVIVPDYTSSVTAADNCDLSLAFSQSPGSGTIISDTTEVTVTVTDDGGNSASCSFDVIPSDDDLPSITCPGDQEEDFNVDCEFEIIDYTGLGTATDNCSTTPTIEQDVLVGTIITGQTTITLTATDGDMNTATCSFEVIPDDNTAPSITCPSDQNESLGNQCQLVLSDYTSLVSTDDNCDTDPTVLQSPVAGTSLGGATVVTITSTDDNGNIGSCTFTVTPADNTAPVLSCPSDITEPFDGDCEFTLPDYTNQIIVSDNCDAPPFTISQVPAAASTITGTTTITFSVTDGAGNTGTCTFDVIPDDDEDPTITCPSDATVSFDPNCQFALADYTGSATVDDNCDNSPVVTQLPNSGSVQTMNTTVTLTATDASGNTASCSFNVIPVDDTNPTVTCPADQNVAFTGFCEFTLLDYTSLATYADNCDNTPFATQSPGIGTVISGQTTVAITVTDDDGNSVTCDFEVIPDDDEDPTIDCPADLTVSLSSSCNFTIPDYTGMANADDNCDASLDFVQSPASGTVISSATSTSVNIQVTDDAGNSAICFFNVVTVDDTDPSLACPSNQNVDFDANCQFTLPDYIAQSTISDNCDPNPTSVQSPAIGGTITETTLISITVTDASGNESACSFNVIPSDNTDPTVTCPSDQNVNFTSDCEFTIPDYTGVATYDDNCDNTPFVTQSPSVGTIVSGTTTVTITVLDDAGNSVNCTFEVLPNDIENPTVDCPSDVTEAFSASCDFLLTDYISLVTTTDNCDTDVDLVQSPASGTTVGSNTTITVTGTDDNGNSASCTFEVILEDQTAPVATCPSDQNVSFGPSCQFTMLSYIGQSSAADNCDGNPAITQSPVAGSSVGGTTVVTISATDASGNVGTCTFNVIPDDSQPPLIIGCPADITVDNDQGSCDAVVTWAAISATDNCEGTVVPTVTTGQGSGTVFPVGTTPVVFTATDGNGNSSTCEFDVTVEDAEDPIIVCPGGINVNVDPTTCGAEVTYAAVTATDNCTSPITPSLDNGFASGSNFPVGTTTVTYTATDGAGNDATCSFDVTVVDDENPVITCPADITTDASPNACNAFVSYSAPTVTDNCATGIVPVLTAGQNSGSSFPVGTTTISYIANDGNGNSATCSFTITVEDNVAPLILACPLDITENVEPNTCGATIFYAAVNATDNCAGAITPTLTSGQASGTVFALDTTTVTYVADDGNGNTTTCSFLVIIVDNEDPVITCPADITITAEANSCGADVTYSLPTITDNCTSPITPQLEVGGASGDNFQVGTTTVTYSADDGNGNTDDCSFEVTVTDDENPVITCPADITVDNDPGVCGADVTYALPTVTDNCTVGIIPTQTLGLASGSTFPVGTTTNRYQAVDDSGNLSLCSFSVTVNDTEDPVLICPSDTIVSTEVGVCQAVVNYAAVTVSDNCTGGITPVLQAGLSSGDPFPEGVNMVTYEGTDAYGNSSTCSFDVTVEDNEIPTIDCPADLTESFNALCELAIPDYTGLGTTADNCDGAPVITQAPTAGTTIVGTTTVTLTSTDFSGNSNTCTFVVTDDTPPTATCPADQQVGYDINCQFTLPDYSLQTTSADNCGATSLTQDPAIGTAVSGQTTVTITVEDDFGNTATCDFEVIPTDNISPSITCLGSQTAFFDSTCQYELPDYTTQASASDNCDTDPTITQSPTATTMVTAPTTITLTATDDSGNSISCSFTVTPVDNEEPTITCPSTQISELDANCEYQLDDYTTLASVADNCDGNVDVTQSPAVGSTQTVGVIVTLTAEDDNGNTVDCIFSVQPEDNIAPTVTCPSDIDVDFDQNCQYILGSYNSLLVADDNCSSVFQQSQSPTQGTAINASTEITLSATDNAGNTSSCSFFVNPTDNTPPEVVCGNNLLVVFDENCEYEIPDYNGFATTSDNCASLITVTQSPAAGTFISGQTTITLTGEDGNGNTASCTFDVIPQDVEPPTITCPGDQLESLNGNCQFIMPDYASSAVVSDNCSSNLVVTQSLGSSSGGIGGQPGNILTESEIIILGVLDDSGNGNSCTFNLTLVDDTPPVVVCPADQNAAFNSDCEAVLLDYATLLTATDNCGLQSGAQSPEAGTVITAVTEVTFTVTDQSGNTSSCSFFVDPADSEAPAITCPTNVTVNVDANCQFEMVDYTGDATVVDNCGTNVTVTQFPPEGTVIVSTTTITLTADDGNGNEADCSFAVQPEDNTDPTIVVCPQDQQIVLDANCAAVMASYTALVSAADNCDANLQVTQVPGQGTSITGAGLQTVVITVQDDNGNTDECSFMVETIDETSPVIDCPADQVLALTANCEFVVPDYTSLATTSDACGTVSVTQSPAAGSVITNTLNATLIAEDESGNGATCTFFVDIIEFEVDVVGTDVSCANGNDGTATVTVSGGTAPYTYDWAGFDPNALEPGFYSVTVTDANGCTAVGEVSIGNGSSLELEIDPSGAVTICEGTSLSIDAGNGYADYDWSTGASVQVITVSNEGTYWVTVTNADGCIADDTVTVSFYNTQSPDVILQSDGMLYCSNDTAQSYQWYQNGNMIPGATDPSYCPTASGNYYVIIVDDNGCTVQSENEEYTFADDSPCAVGVEEFGLSMDIFPNPSNGLFTLNYSLDHQMQLQLAVFDMMGRQVTDEFQLSALSGTKTLDLSKEAEGVYMLRIVVDGEEMLQERLILTK